MKKIMHGSHFLLFLGTLNYCFSATHHYTIIGQRTTHQDQKGLNLVSPTLQDQFYQADHGLREIRWRGLPGEFLQSRFENVPLNDASSLQYNLINADYALFNRHDTTTLDPAISELHFSFKNTWKDQISWHSTLSDLPQLQLVERSTQTAGLNEHAYRYQQILSFHFSRYPSYSDNGGLKSDADYLRDWQFSQKFSYQKGEKHFFDFITFYADRSQDLDQFGGAGGDDPDYTSLQRWPLFSAKYRYQISKMWNIEQQISWQEKKRLYQNPSESMNMTEEYSYRAKKQTYAIRSHYEHHRFLFENEIQYLQDDIVNHEQTLWGPPSSLEKTEAQTSLDLRPSYYFTKNLWTSFRFKHEKQNKSQNTHHYRAEVGYQDFSLYGEEQTVRPALYQRFSPFGYSSLLPQLQQQIGLNFFSNSFALNLWYGRYSRLITFLNSRYENSTETTIWGAVGKFSHSIGPLKFNIPWQILLPKYKLALAGRALLQASLEAECSLSPSYTLSSKMRHRGPRSINSSTSLPSLTTYDFILAYTPQSFPYHQKFSLQFDNIFNHSFHEWPGYKAPGRVITLQWSFNE
jgi:hypothetical protein